MGNDGKIYIGTKNYVSGKPGAHIATIDIASGEKTYYLPSCRDYNQVIVDEAYGDEWFCSEIDALDQKFIKSKRC